MEEELNNQVDKLTLPVDISQPLTSISTLTRANSTDTTWPHQYEVLLTKTDPATVKGKYLA